MTRILIADDNSDDRYMLEALLNRYSYDVLSAGNGAEALELARKEPPDAIISDIIMPVMDGFALCREWKNDEKLKTIPFIFYTATYTTYKDEVFAISLGADRFIIKPQEPEALVLILREVMGKKFPSRLAVSGFPLGEEMEFFRKYNEVLFEKLEKKAIQLNTKDTERKRTEEKLQQSQSMLQSFFDFLGIMGGIVEVVAEDDVRHIVDNTVTAGFIGTTPEAMKNKLGSELGEPREILRKWVVFYKQSQSANKPVSFDYMDKRGEKEAWLSATVSYLGTGPNGRPRFAYGVLDITERKQAERTFIKSKELIQNVLNSMNDAISVIDINNFKIIDVNSVFLDTYGLNKEDVIGKPCYEITHNRTEPCAPPDDTCPLLETKSSGEHSIFEHVHYIKDGKKQYVEVSASPIKDENGKVVNVVHVARDITKRKRAEEALKESEERYRTIIEYSNNMIWTMDREGRFLFINEFAEERSGYKLEDWRGRRFTQFIDKKDLPRIMEILRKTLEGEPQQYEVNIAHKNGSNIILAVNSAPIYSNGKIVGTVSFGRDITEQKKMEELYIENERLTAADKAKNEFLAIMSHELRSPLHSIIGFSDILKRGMVGELNGEQKHYVSNVLTSSKHLLALINDLLDLSQIESGKMGIDIEKIYLHDFIIEILAPVKEKAAKSNIIIKIDLDSQLEFIEADRLRFKQILFNLLDNAVKFRKNDGGNVTIKIIKTDNMAQFSVSDTGIGIKEENMKKLFNKFTQSDSGLSRKYGGTGLGLAITKQLVELHGGKIWAQSQFGEGSIFTFTLPLKSKK